MALLGYESGKNIYSKYFLTVLSFFIVIDMNMSTTFWHISTIVQILFFKDFCIKEN